ncbi:MAG: hypothetical protein AAFP76_01520 [Bacteroidota bacterium]
MKKLLFTTFVLFCLGCEGDEDRFADCSTVLCAADQFVLTYQDGDGNPLIGTVFVQDSFKLASIDTILYIKPIPFGEEENLALLYANIESNTKYGLELSETITDTLRFDFTTVNGTCCVTSTMEALRLNGTIVPETETNFYTLIKE